MMPGMTSRIMRMRGMIINSKFANFPLVYNIILLALTDAYPGGRMNSGIEDATIVATQMVLAAANEGVGSCWINYFDPDKLASDLGLPENEDILMLLDLGYAAEGAGPLDNHFKRKDLSETVSYI